MWCEQYLQIASAGLSESLDLNSSEESGAEKNFSSKHPLKVIVRARSQSTCRLNKDDKGNEYTVIGTTTCATTQKEGTEGSGEEMVTADWTERFCGRRVEEMVGSARENAEPRES